MQCSEGIAIRSDAGTVRSRSRSRSRVQFTEETLRIEREKERNRRSLAEYFEQYRHPRRRQRVSENEHVHYVVSEREARHGRRSRERLEVFVEVGGGRGEGYEGKGVRRVRSFLR